MKIIIVATPQAKGYHKSYFELCVNSLIKKNIPLFLQHRRNMISR